MRGDGKIYWRGNHVWIVYYVRGKRFRESAAGIETAGKSEQVIQAARKKAEAAALKMLKARMREIHGDRFVGPQQERVMVDELADNLILHLKTKGARAVASFESHLKPVREFFSLTRAVDVTTAKVQQYQQARLQDRPPEEKAPAPATINREIGALKQALNLARKQGRLSRVPYIPMLKENNARKGFFERPEFEAVATNLPDPIRDIARFAYLSGWRKGEILPLTWEAVDRAAGEVRLSTSKNGHGRVLPLDGELADLIERRWVLREYQKHGMSHVSEYVFHRKGKPTVDLRKSWAAACKVAKVPGKLFHDLRRTAVRDMVRAGVPQSVAMSISGHRTVSIFLRYNITSGDDMRAAIRRTQEYRAAVSMERNMRSLPSESESR